MAKKTVKDLNIDFKLLQEKFEHLKIDQEEKVNIIKSDFGDRIKKLEDKILGLEHMDGLEAVKEKESTSTIKCKECSL